MNRINLNKGFTVRVIKPVDAHRGVEVKYLYAATLKDLDLLLIRLRVLKLARVDVLDERHQWVPT